MMGNTTVITTTAINSSIVPKLMAASASQPFFSWLDGEWCLVILIVG